MNYHERAIQIAVEAHAGQEDRQGQPYILHPLRVMHKVGKHLDTTLSAAAVLHDVIEDCSPKYERAIGFEMPERVSHLVRLLSNGTPQEWKKLSEEEKEKQYFEYVRMIATDHQAKIIKLADLTDNLFHPARRAGWIGHPKSKARYLRAYFYLQTGEWS